MEVWDVVVALLRLVLAGVFVVSGVAKLVDIPGSQQAVRDLGKPLGLPEALAKPGGYLVPIVELVLAVLLLPISTVTIGAWLGFLLLAAFTAGISMNLAKGNTPDCHCFGQLSTTPIGKGTLYRNAGLLVLAFVIGVSGLAGRPGASLVGWTGGLEVFNWILLALVIVMAVVMGGVVWLLVHLLGQNGRLLVRMDSLEEALSNANINVDDDDEDYEDDDEEEEGLPIGAAAPAFSLTGLYGETATLDSLRARGNPVLLVFSDPTCGPCNALMPDVGRWQRNQSSKLTVALVSRGSVDANKGKSSEHGLTNVLLQKDNEVADDYLTDGTPTAVLVWPNGLIASDPAGGGDAIRKLVTSAVEGKIKEPEKVADAPRAVKKPTPIKAAAPAPGGGSIGKPAPAVALKDLDNKDVTLDTFKGSPVALLFWNPTCGFCARMVDDLKAWEANKPADAPKLLIVSTGDVASNKAQGFTSTMVLDGGFNTGRAYGASGTPSAVLVDAEGKIASAVGVGSPAVLGILNNNLPAGGGGGGDDAGDDSAGVPAVGSPAPVVRLADVDGKMVDLAEQKGDPTLLVFWNPGCGFCQRMVDDIKSWEANPPADAPKMMLVSTGTPEENKKHGFKSTVLIDRNFSIGNKFGANGTPSAILVDAEGKIGSGLAVGGPNVMELAGKKS